MANPDPFRLRVLKALTAALQTITPANGYTFDLSTSVFRGRRVFGDNDPIPLVSILEAPVAESPLVSPEGGRQSKISWDLLLQGFVDDDYENPSDPAHALLAEVKKALIAERRRTKQQGHILGMGSPMVDLIIGSGVVRPPEEHISEKAHFWMSVTIVFVENLDDPYA